MGTMTPLSRAVLTVLVSALLAEVSGCAGSRPVASSPAAPRLGRAKMSIIENNYAAGNHAFSRRDWQGASDGFYRVYSVNSKDDIAVYLAAATWVRAGKPEAAFEWLQRLWQMGSCLTPSEKSFSAMANDPRFKDADAIIRAQAVKEHRAVVAFTLPEKDLVPESIAYDPVEKVFYVSSLWKRKIVRVVPGGPGAPAVTSDFVGEGADSLDAVLGMKVDAVRRRLWAVSAAEPEMKGFTPETYGRSALYEYDLVSKTLVRKITLQGLTHLFNDLVLDAAGNVYVTDTESAEVHVLRAGDRELKTLVPKRPFVAPNGIALSADGKHLYVADVAQGLFHVDPATGEVQPLDQAAGLFPAGLDGLVLHEGWIIGIMNVVSAGRVARWRLVGDGTALGEGEVLECCHPSFHQPTRGVVADGAFYFIANSQSDQISDGALATEKLADIVILRLPLSRHNRRP
jgi:sugar lactone lactonase YvrE